MTMIDDDEDTRLSKSNGCKNVVRRNQSEGRHFGLIIIDHYYWSICISRNNGIMIYKIIIRKVLTEE